MRKAIVRLQQSRWNADQREMRDQIEDKPQELEDFFAEEGSQSVKYSHNRPGLAERPFLAQTPVK